ncbi:MAG: TylF/MycF/NovP-related O-methyltransferase [Candidatus Binatia bacterium]
MNPKFVKLIKEMQFNSPLRRYFFPRYTYKFSPPQICFLCYCIENTKHIDGAISEVGCAAGSTTVFLKKYMAAQNIDKDYYAIDTFSGFVSEDIDFEVANRGKRRELFRGFQVNKKKWFDATMRQNKIAGVRSIEADVNTFDLRTIGPLAFSLLDVDLYRPMKKALRELYEVLSPGGIIVVDDCDSSNVRWDGSDQAYKEFVKDVNQSAQIVHGKLGVIKKPA